MAGTSRPTASSSSSVHSGAHSRPALGDISSDSASPSSLHWFLPLLWVVAAAAASKDAGPVDPVWAKLEWRGMLQAPAPALASTASSANSTKGRLLNKDFMLVVLGVAEGGGEGC